MKTAVVITGGSGLLAVNWAMAVRDRYPVTLGLHRREIALAGVDTQEIDLESTEKLKATLESLQPCIAVHAAGLTSVEECEADPALAHHVNVELAVTVAQACADLHLPLVHISTDHLSSGERALVEEDFPVGPVNVYAQTKAEAEARVLERYPGALVARTNFFAWGPSYRHSFSDLIIASLRAGKEVILFRDVFFTPILVEALVEATHQLVAMDSAGIFNLVGDERVSKYEFGLKIAEKFDLDSKLIKSGLLRDQVSLVQRPCDMSLSNRKTRDRLGKKLGNVDVQLERLLQQERSGIAREVQQL